jgi:Outer membrane protein beta-barrel domain
MHPLSDKDLDRLSREAAEQYDVEQNTSGWESLEQRLNKQLPEKGKKERRRFLFFIWLLALISGGGLLWMLTGDDTPQLNASKHPSSNDEVSTAPKNTDPKEKSLPERSSADLPQSDNNSSVSPADKSTANEETHTGFPDRSINQGNASPRTITGKSNRPQKKSADVQNTTDNVRRNTAKKNRNRTDADVHVSPIPETAISKDNQNADNLSDKKVQGESSPPVAVPAPQNADKVVSESAPEKIAEQLNTDSATASPLKKSTISKNNQGFKKGFELGLVGGPDMSNVKFKNTDKVGYNVGVQLGYRLSDRWSVHTGVLYTRKNYTSNGDDFHPPKGTWLDNIKLEEVEGSCFMFDIPLNVRYDLNTHNKHRYFVSTGLSSYLMKEEDYHYYYQYANGGPGYRHRSYSSTEYHWLSILNISAGYEKKLSSRLSLQVEPYLKIPLSGVGYGSIQLNSYGMYFSLKYHAKKR